MPACLHLQRTEAPTFSWQELMLKAKGHGQLSVTGIRSKNGDRAAMNTATGLSTSPTEWPFPRSHRYDELLKDEEFRAVAGAARRCTDSGIDSLIG